MAETYRQMRNYQNLEGPVKMYSEFGHVKSKKELYHYMQGLIKNKEGIQCKDVLMLRDCVILIDIIW